MGEDCPVFDGLYDYCRVYTGGSIDGAKRLNAGVADVAAEDEDVALGDGVALVVDDEGGAVLERPHH